jgi:hypothetical protein
MYATITATLKEGIGGEKFTNLTAQNLRIPLTSSTSLVSEDTRLFPGATPIAALPTGTGTPFHLEGKPTSVLVVGDGVMSMRLLDE